MIKITSKDNSLVKHITKLNKSAKYRRECEEFAAEGVRICIDALNSGAKISSLIVCEDILDKYSDVIERIKAVADNSYVFSKTLFREISETKSPQGIVCVIKPLDKHSLFDKMECNGKFIALDNIQDPSNMGTILRTAEAVGIDGVILSSDCCDIYSPKVVRGSMGAVFRLPYIIKDSISDFILEHKNITSYASVVDADAEKITHIGFECPCVVVIGNEGNGLKQSTIDVCNKKITIPMNGRAESLNASVAAAIIIWEMVK
ncbi:MAG: RNA methyltransferase [Ruminococcus sp.]|nr:RNA methyltransferase [Ruminococcus sp.]